MKKTKLFISLCFTVSVLQAQYYVSSTGSDTNGGTKSQPFRTIQKAANVLVAGDTCYIMQGVYRETVTPENNGTAAKKIVYTKYQNDKVLIIGTEKVTNWTLYKNGIYKTYFPDSVSQLSVNKTMAVKARYPNFTGNQLSSSDWASVKTVVNSPTLVFPSVTFAAGYWNGATCVALTGSKWVAFVGKVTATAGNTLTCDNRSFPWNDPTRQVKQYIGNGSGYLTDHLNALDATNEWHWQNDTLYFKPQDATQINNYRFEARVRQFGFNCTNKEYIELNSLQFVWANVSFENSKSNVLDNCSVLFPTASFFYDSSWDRSAFDATNFGISTWKGKGVSMSGTSNTIKNCYIAHSWGDGISVGGQNNTVQNCLVEDCAWSGSDVAAISTVGKNHLITKNTIRKTGRSAMLNRKTSTSDITYNNISDCGYLTADLGLVYSYESNGNGSQIAYNWVHDNHALSTGDGIYLDNRDTAFIVHHNVIWNTTSGIRTNKPAVNHQIYNNTVWGSTNAIDAWGNTGTVLTNQIVRNNLSNKAWSTGTTQSNNLTVADSKFSNASTFDFTLTATSPAINYGVNIPGITTNTVGVAPDAGAYEYGAPIWIPGTNTLAVDAPPMYDPLNPATPQTINFAALNTINIGQSVTAAASASSGLVVVLSSSDASIISIFDGKLQANAMGNCVITASQPGDENYLAATSISQTVSVNNVAGISTKSTDSGISLYPNPAKNKATIKLDAAEPTRIEVKNMLGYTVSVSMNESATEIQLNTTDLIAGTYFVCIKSKTKNQVLKLSIQK